MFGVRSFRGSSACRALKPQDTCLTLIAGSADILSAPDKRRADALLEKQACSFRLIFNCSWYDAQGRKGVTIVWPF